jgi:hypothetical protein
MHDQIDVRGAMWHLHVHSHELEIPMLLIRENEKISALYYT